MERRKFLKGAAIGAAGSALATPALAQNAKTMTIVSTWPRDLPGLGVSAQRLASRIAELSDGAIQTEYFAAGERVSGFDAFDEVASGNSDAYIGADYYWIGKNPALAYFTAVPFGMTYAEINAWVEFGEGRALWDRLQDEFGLYGLPAGNTGTQTGGWFNKEIESPDDLKGLKFRVPGLGGQVFSKAGASTVSLAGGQIYENLVSGAIDAAEFVGPLNDYFLKFYEAARYYYTVGVHEPGAQLSLTSNKSWWSTLSDFEKAVVTAAAKEENAIGYYENMALNGLYLNKMVEEQGVELRSFNEDIWDTLYEAALEVTQETRDSSPLAAEIDDSFQASMRDTGRVIKLTEFEFVKQRNRLIDLG